ncbi:MAG: BatD family protein, partial [Gammaproteobacteria bacterium]|nr:BatD family protein [Gammaproteobacteria bacterium]
PKVKVTTTGVTLQIQPTDAQFTPWLAATAVKLEASWPDGTDNLRAGVPIKRHIRVVASDQLPAAIPPLQHASTETLRTYPGIPELQLDKTPEGVTGTRLETMTLIPAAAGNITLPAVQLDWWNTGTGQWERSTLPAQQISVGQGAMLTPATQASLYQYATALLALVCVLLAVALWRVSRKAGNQSAVTTVTQFQAPVTETDLWQALQHAARQNNYTAFRINLKRWLKKHRTTVENLGSLDAGVLDELQQIDRIRFGAVNPTGTTVSAKQQLGSVLPGLKRLRKRLRTDTDERLPDSRGQRVRQKLYPD